MNNLPYIFIVIGVVLLFFRFKYKHKKQVDEKPPVQKKEKEQSAERKPFIIGSLINHHFCIQTTDIGEVLGALPVKCKNDDELYASQEWVSWVSYPEGKETEFVLYYPVNGWVYLQWSAESFERNKEMAKTLSDRLQKQVFYFFIDPWAFICCWVVARNGMILRAFEESHNKTIYSEGSLDIEKELQYDDSYWENKYWELNSAVCQPIDCINQYPSIKVIRGILE